MKVAELTRREAEVLKRLNSGGAKVTLGLLLALVSASGGMNSMISALNGAYAVRDSRPWYKTRAIAIVLTVAISILIVCNVAGYAQESHIGNVVGTAKRGKALYQRYCVFCHGQYGDGKEHQQWGQPAVGHGSSPVHG